MTFSFIIINYNTLDLTRQCLNSIFSVCQKNDFEIILIDNASSDNSVEILEKEFSEKVRLIENKENIGFSAANNQGAKLAQGKYLFFLNSDTKLTANILPIIANIFVNQANFGILAPQLLTANLSPQAGAHGRFPTLSSLTTRKTKENWKKIISPSLWQTDWVSGAALIIRKELFEKINGWDENFFLYFEDVDLCLRAHKVGAKVGLCPEASLIHYCGSSLKQNRKRKLHYYRSQNYFFYKHYGITTSLLMRLIRWPYKLYSCWIKK